MLIELEKKLDDANTEIASLRKTAEEKPESGCPEFADLDNVSES